MSEMAVSGGMTDDWDDSVVEVIDNSPEVPTHVDPHEQARARFDLLNKSFASMIAVIGQMYVDRDWEYLSRPDGTPYSNLSEVVSDALQVSLSMARRYVQGARDFHVPLMDFIVEGTAMQITSGEIADLGRDGTQEAVDLARERLDGVTDPDEQAAAIRGAVDETLERRSKPAEDADPFDDDDFDVTPSDGIRFSDGASDGFADDGFDDEPSSAPADTDHVEVDLADPFARVMEGAQTYESPEDLAQLPEELRDVVAALVTLAGIEDPAVLARLVTYETRGVLVPVDDALANMARFQGLVETLPWFMAHLTV